MWRNNVLNILRPIHKLSIKLKYSEGTLTEFSKMSMPVTVKIFCAINLTNLAVSVNKYDITMKIVKLDEWMKILNVLEIFL